MFSFGDLKAFGAPLNSVNLAEIFGIDSRRAAKLCILKCLICSFVKIKKNQLTVSSTTYRFTTSLT